MRWKELSEAPISNLSAVGDLDQEGSFRDSDLKAIRNPKWVKKVTDLYAKVPFPINLYLYNAHQAKYLTADGEIDVRDLSKIRTYAGGINLRQARMIIGELPDNWSESLNVILMTNEGDGRMALTPWMIGHRLVHALLSQTQRDALPQGSGSLFAIYSDLINSLRRFLDASPLFDYDPDGNQPAQVARVFGTTRAAREGKHINDGEWLVDMCTQWLVRGKVFLQRPMMDEKGLTPKLPPVREEKLLKLAVYFYVRHFFGLGDQSAENPDTFLDWMIEKGELDEEKEPNLDNPRYQRDSYVAFNKQNRAVAAFGDPGRVKGYEDDGLRVVRLTGQDKLAQDEKLYRTYLNRRKRIGNLYAKWLRMGYYDAPSATMSDRLNNAIDQAEERLNRAIAEYFKSMVGKFYLL